MSAYIAGKQVITCSDCGYAVRIDLLNQHQRHCRAKIHNSPQLSSPNRANVAVPPSSESAPTPPKPKTVTAVHPHPKPVPTPPKPKAAATVHPHPKPAPTPPKPKAMPKLPRPKRAPIPTPTPNLVAPSVIRETECPICHVLIKDKDYDKHTIECSWQKDQQEAQAQMRTARTKTPTNYAYTRDHYRISQCWSCGQRICLVPTTVRGQTSDEEHDIVRNHCAGLHQCTGSKPDSRRSILIYTGTKPNQSR